MKFLEVASLGQQPEKSEPFDALVARFTRLQVALAGASLPRLPDATATAQSSGGTDRLAGGGDAVG
ncbi:MAG: hypothetical protein KGL50_15390 [Burkholderiales bacterium]|nr:hypothetical protein [Burkholderiales bacterium]